MAIYFDLFITGQWCVNFQMRIAYVNLDIFVTLVNFETEVVETTISERCDSL